MSLEDFPGWWWGGGGGGGEKLEIRLNSAQLELEAWAELGKKKCWVQKYFGAKKLWVHKGGRKIVDWRETQYCFTNISTYKYIAKLSPSFQHQLG